MPRFNRILITGAAGVLGGELRKGLPHMAKHLRLNDRIELGQAAEQEEHVICDLNDKAAVHEMCKEVDAIVHFGGAATENTFDEVLESSIKGSYYIYEAARKNGVKRIVYASSIHSVGYYPREQIIDSDTPHNPDTIYGVSKCFVEDLAKYYWNEFGMETVCLRICSSLREPNNRRALGTWLSFRDCVQLVERSLMAPRVGHTVIYGTSNNRENSTSNHKATHIGYQPQDNAEDYRKKVEAMTEPGDPHLPDIAHVGGFYVGTGHFEDTN